MSDARTCEYSHSGYCGACDVCGVAPSKPDLSAVREGFVRVHVGDFEALLAENRRLYAQVMECQAANATLLERARTAEARWNDFWVKLRGDGG